MHSLSSSTILLYYNDFVSLLDSQSVKELSKASRTIHTLTYPHICKNNTFVVPMDNGLVHYNAHKIKLVTPTQSSSPAYAKGRVTHTTHSRAHNGHTRAHTTDTRAHSKHNHAYT